MLFRSFRQPLLLLGKRDSFDWRSCEHATANQELVERAQRRESKLRGGTAQALAPEMTEIEAKIVAPEGIPRGGPLMLLLMPRDKIGQRLAVVPEGIGRSAPLIDEVLKERVDKFVSGWRFWRRHGSQLNHRPRKTKPITLLIPRVEPEVPVRAGGRQAW